MQKFSLLLLTTLISVSIITLMGDKNGGQIADIDTSFRKPAGDAGVKTVVLSHLSERADGSNDYTPWVVEVKKHFSGEVFVAKDLMEFQPVHKKKEN